MNKLHGHVYSLMGIVKSNFNNCTILTVKKKSKQKKTKLEVFDLICNPSAYRTNIIKSPFKLKYMIFFSSLPSNYEIYYYI